MVVDSVPDEFPDLKIQVYRAVSEQKISSLQMISQMIGETEDATRYALQELIDEGSLDGVLTEDGTRFFLSEVKVSDAPIAGTHEEYAINHRDTRVGKAVFLSGIAVMIGGFIARGLMTVLPVMEHVGSSIVLLGMAVLAAGWLQVSRSMPPDELRKH
jgi:hypothetical protein